MHHWLKFIHFSFTVLLCHLIRGMPLRCKRGNAGGQNVRVKDVIGLLIIDPNYCRTCMSGSWIPPQWWRICFWSGGVLIGLVLHKNNYTTTSPWTRIVSLNLGTILNIESCVQPFYCTFSKFFIYHHLLFIPLEDGPSCGWLTKNNLTTSSSPFWGQ